MYLRFGRAYRISRVRILLFTNSACASFARSTICSGAVRSYTVSSPKADRASQLKSPVFSGTPSNTTSFMDILLAEITDLV